MNNGVYRIKPATIFLDSQKVGTCQNSTIDVASGDEMMVTEEGYSGHSDGVVTTRIQFTRIVPYGDTRLDMIGIINGKRYVTVQALGLDGKAYTWIGRILSSSYKSDHKTGSLTGDFTFEGGAPEAVG